MNFLAHFHLAWPDAPVVAGALEGEYFRGLLHSTRDHPLAIGIKQHRAIDAFTDAHPDIAELRKRFPADLRRYSGILIDLSFDHYLSKHWNQFCDVPLDEFTRRIYESLDDAREDMSESARHMHDRMVQYDILSLYTDWTTVPQAARNIGRRFTRGNPLADVAPDLEPLRSSMETTFLDFYPELLAFSQTTLSSLHEG